MESVHRLVKMLEVPEMAGSRSLSMLSSLLFGAVAFCWTLAGETSNPQLLQRDLPTDVLNSCDTCAIEGDMRSRWIGRTSRGDLFLVGRSACATGNCMHWLVEKGKAPARVLLEIDGNFTLNRVSGRYPMIEVRSRYSDNGTVYLRYEWTGEQYARTSDRRVYEVNGVECGTREECGAAAEHALKSQKVDRALRIWQRVYGVSWI